MVEVNGKIKGRLITIHKLSDKACQVVIKKTIKGKATAVAITVFGFWKDKLDALKLQKNDKIEAYIYLRSKFLNNRWYTDVEFKEVKRCVPKPKYNPYTNSYENPIAKEPKHTLFEDTPEQIEKFGGGYMVDEETGEIKF